MLGLEEYKIKFDNDLKKFLEKEFLKLDQVWHENFNSQKETYLTDKLIDYTIESVNGGKRFRPYLVYLMSESDNYEDSVNFAIAIELLHSFALVHDDIMDKSETRRGEKSIYKFFLDNLKSEVEDIDKTHIAYSMAILIGDYLFSLCEGAFSQTENPKARQFFQILKSEVILGQMLDVELGLKLNPTEDEIKQKTYLKTANYSVSRPMQIGCLLNKYDETKMQFCLDFGFHLGLAFQIQDDYLNLVNPIEITGKKQFSDIEEGKHTLATWYLQNSSNQEIKTKFTQEYFGKKDFDSIELQKLLTESGAIEYMKELFENHYNECLKFNCSKELKDLVYILAKRNK